MKNNDKLPFGSVFIKSESVRNDGNIISENLTNIETKTYEGKGSIISGNIKAINEKWYAKPTGILILGIIASLIAGLVLYFYF